MGDGTAPTASPEEAVGGATCIAPSAGGVSATASTASPKEAVGGATCIAPSAGAGRGPAPPPKGSAGRGTDREGGAFSPRAPYASAEAGAGRRRVAASRAT